MGPDLVRSRERLSRERLSRVADDGPPYKCMRLDLVSGTPCGREFQTKKQMYDHKHKVHTLNDRKALKLSPQGIASAKNDSETEDED